MKLGKIKSNIYDKAVIVALSKDWLDANNGKPLEFEAKLERNHLVLSARLETLDRTKEVVSNVM